MKNTNDLENFVNRLSALADRGDDAALFEIALNTPGAGGRAASWLSETVKARASGNDLRENYCLHGYRDELKALRNKLAHA